jgi:hypothetical protein
MNGLVLFLVAQALTINDICAEPIVDPKSPAPACVIEMRQLIETEHFSLTIEPRQVVHFYRDGRLLEVMPSIRQSPILIAVSVDERPVQETISSLAFYNCPAARLEQEQLLRCERRDESGNVTRLYAGLRGEHVITVSYSRSARVEGSPGEEEKFERMLESIKIVPL